MKKRIDFLLITLSLKKPLFRDSHFYHLAVVSELDVVRKQGIDFGMSSDVVAAMDEKCARSFHSTDEVDGIGHELVRVMLFSKAQGIDDEE